MATFGLIGKYLPSIAKKLELDPDSELAGKLRASQIRTVMSTTPLMMVIITVIALIMTAVLYGRPGAEFAPYWACAMALLGGFVYLNASANNKRPFVLAASKRAPVKAIKFAFISGSMWGVVPAVLYPVADFQSKIMVLSVIGGILGGGAMSLYVIPRALFAFLGAVVLGTAIGLARSGQSVDLAIFAFLSFYMIALMRGGWTLAVNFAESAITSIKLNEKSETISLLLKDFSENASDWLWQTDKMGHLEHGQEGFIDNLGLVPESFGPEHPADADASANITQVKGMQDVRRHWNQRAAFTDIQLSASLNGATRWVNISGKPIFDAKGQYAGFRGVAANITKNKQAEERIAFLAHNDALTGLVNRAQFSREISAQLSRKNQKQIWAVMFLDLDGFKLVNDSKGHGVGDRLLEEVAARIKRHVGENDVVARLGGDEFAILCRSAPSVQALSTKAERLIEAISATYDLNNGNSVAGVGVSIGISLGIKDGVTEDALLHNADLALYRSKLEGKGTYRFFKLEMDEVVRERRMLEQDLREAMQNEEFSLSYQPLVSADHQKIEGFEALIRWNHPARGTVSPADFIPVAESMGLISDIGDWVIREACKQAASWPSHLFVAVNLSPQQFIQGRIIQSVTRALIASGLQPSRLELEVTEGLLIDNTEEVTYALRELKGMGVSVALDDFGTGYSSLSYLLKFPFDKLKIDRSFISAIEGDEVARNVLEAIAKLGNVLDLKVTAEGVETLDQVEALKAFNCTHFQGFLFGKPLVLDDLPAYLLETMKAHSEARDEELAPTASMTGTGHL